MVLIIAVFNRISKSEAVSLMQKTDLEKKRWNIIKIWKMYFQI